MPVLGAVIGGVAAIGGAVIKSGAAGKATEQQIQASREAEAARERRYQEAVGYQQPYMQGGLTAQNRLFTLLGLNPNAGQPAVSGGAGVPRAYQTPYGTFNLPAGGYGGAAPATNAQGIVVDPNSPDFGKYARDFGMQDFEQDPGYAFRLSEGQKAIERSAAARGGLQSGAALKAAARYGQEMGSQEYTNAFKRYQINRANQLDPLYGLVNTGSGAANTLTRAAVGQGENQAAEANARGSYASQGTVAKANAWGGAFDTLGKDIGNAFARSSTYGNDGLNSVLNSRSGYFPSSKPSWNGTIDVGPTQTFGSGYDPRSGTYS
jgi:hypothetical protein